MSRPLVIQTEDLSANAVAFLRERCELVQCPAGDEARFAEMIGRADALVVRTYTRVDAALLARAPRLKVVGRAGVGLDSIDVEACKARGVRVVYTPDANSRAVAEYVFAMLFDALRPRVFLERALPTPEWNTLRRELLAPRELGSLTLGVLGLGRIGTRVARIGAGFGMRVLYHDVREIKEENRAGATPVSRDELYTMSDVISIHVDNRPENRHCVGDRVLDLCKPDAIIVNAARGFIVDAAALAAFLHANPNARALLDVHDPEPFREDSPLLGLPNAHLSPHIAAATSEAHENMSAVVHDVWRVLNGQQPVHGA